jgi:ribose/xylose/arabinose/galactoside ABC-type transport system permease subunit
VANSATGLMNGYRVGWIGLVSIVVSIMTTVIAVGVSSRPAAAPLGPFELDRRAFNNPTFVDAFVSLVNIVFAFCKLMSVFLRIDFPLTGVYIRWHAGVSQWYVRHTHARRRCRF